MKKIITLLTIATALFLTACVSTRTDQQGNRYVTAADESWGADVKVTANGQLDRVVIAGPVNLTGGFPTTFRAWTDIDAETGRPVIYIKHVFLADEVEYSRWVGETIFKIDDPNPR